MLLVHEAINQPRVTLGYKSQCIATQWQLNFMVYILIQKCTLTP